MSKITTGMLAIVAGVGGSIVLFWILNQAVDRLPKRWAERLRPYAFIGPALFMVAVFLIYPALRSIRDSFYGDRSEEFVGLDNYRQLIDDPSLRSTLLNNVVWVIFVPVSCVVFGLAMAVLADRLSSTLGVECPSPSCSCRWRSARSARARSGCSSTTGARPDGTRSVCSTRSGPASATNR